MTASTRALVLFSGGQDSTTCLAQALSDCAHVESVFFDYGQRHLIEKEQAGVIAARVGIPLHVIDVPMLSQLNPNALTNAALAIEQPQNELPSTFVPGRNALFLTLAATLAYQNKLSILYTGVCQTDYSGYPDCRDDFIQSMQASLSLAMDTSFQIRTPLMWLTKADTVRLMDSLGQLDILADTHTCYEGLRPACGQCPACLLRLKGFKEAGLIDPLSYLSVK